MTSSNPSVAPVPASVTIPAGTTRGGFNIFTTSVAAQTVVTISVSGGGVTVSAPLTVNPAASPPPSGPLPAPTLVSPAADARFAPGAAITFDWSDVSGAGSYTIHIANTSNFTAPLTVNQNVTASHFTASTLPVQTMWWRVRANDASGNPGPGPRPGDSR